MDIAPTSGRMALAIGAGFVLLILAGVLAIVAALASSNADRWSDHSQVVRQTAGRLFSLVQDAETGQRGFLLTGDASYLKPFNAAAAELSGVENALRALVADNPLQTARLDHITALADRRISRLGRTVEVAATGDVASAIAMVKTNRGRDVMDEIRSAMAEFDQQEVSLATTRTAHAAFRRQVMLTTIAAAVLVAGGLWYLVVLRSRHFASDLLDRNNSLLREMAARERAEGILRHTQKMDALGRLTGGVAHDFNNMLAIIIGNLDILLRRLSGSDVRARTMVENALAGAQRAAGLTKQLLAFSRLQPLQPQPTDVNKCVGDLSELLRRTLGSRIEVETILAGGLWPASVDPPQLESAILNLAINSRDAMGGQGRLTIETANAVLDQAYADAHFEVMPGQYVMVAITDTGSGMTDEVMSKAFDPFFTTKGTGEGTGLGLSQVHGFAKQSNGHVKLYSELGQGTTAKVYLPRDFSKVSPKPVSGAAVEPAVATGQKVLVVEDDGGVRGFAISALQELGYEPIEADNAIVALERLREHPDITILLTDVVMPDMNGRKLADLALADRSDLIVLFMTGYTRNAIVHNGSLDPGVRLLSKPFTLDDLDRELRAIRREKALLSNNGAAQ